jgi:hypothetical protein
LKSGKFFKEAPQNRRLERMTIAGPQGMSENNGFGGAKRRVQIKYHGHLHWMF